MKKFFEKNSSFLHLKITYIGDHIFEIGLPDSKTIDELNEIISDTDSTEYSNSDIYTMVYEESQKFFNGDCTAEECAEATQDRVSIYLSEKK